MWRSATAHFRVYLAILGISSFIDPEIKVPLSNSTNNVKVLSEIFLLFCILSLKESNCET